MKSLRDRADGMIATNRYMTLATATTGGNPWISPLFFAYKDGRFYWYSPKEARHSRLITKNPKVAITLFDSRATPEKADGLYIQGYARVLRKSECLPALRLLANKTYTDRFHQNKLLGSPIDFTGRSPLRLYVAEAKQMWVLGPLKMYRGKYLDSRENVALISN